MVKQCKIYQKLSCFYILYLHVFFSQEPLVEHSASLLCGKSYAWSEGDARVNGTGQRPG